MKTDNNLEWLVFLDHAYNVIRAIADKEGSEFVRTFIEGVLEEHEEEPDTTA